MSARFRLALKPAAAAAKPVAAATATKPVAAAIATKPVAAAIATKPVAAATATVTKAPKISDVVKQLLAKEAITTKALLEAWCGEAGREALYAYVRAQVPEHWDRLADPKASTRAVYQALLAGYGDEASSSSDEGEGAFGARIRTCGEAEALIGKICTYITAEGREYGCILRATASEIILERLAMTAAGGFALHSVPVCPRSRNRVAYSRNIRLVEGGGSAMGGVKPKVPAPPPLPASLSAETLALKLAEELADAQRREITRLAAVEAELLAVKAKAAAARLARNEASRRSKAKRAAVAGATGAVVTAAAATTAKDEKPHLDVFDFFPELVEELAEEDPIVPG
jgi:hypothetical protein